MALAARDAIPCMAASEPPDMKEFSIPTLAHSVRGLVRDRLWQILHFLSEIYRKLFWCETHVLRHPAATAALMWKQFLQSGSVPAQIRRRRQTCARPAAGSRISGETLVPDRRCAAIASRMPRTFLQKSQKGMAKPLLAGSEDLR